MRPFSTALDPNTHAANALRNKMDGLVKTYQAKELAERMDSLMLRCRWTRSHTGENWTFRDAFPTNS